MKGLQTFAFPFKLAAGLNTEVEMIDYAYPTMMAEKALKELHEAMLANKFEAAKEAALRCMSECKIAYHAITISEEKNAGQTSARA